jgi:integrase
MARPRSDTKFHVFPHKNSSIWWVWFWQDAEHKKPRKRISTATLSTGPLSQDDYSLEQAQELVNAVTGVKRAPAAHSNTRLSVAWTLEYMEDRIIGVEGKKKATWYHYRSSLLMFQEIYGPSYNLANFKPADIYDYQSAVVKKGKSPVTVNTYCRGMAAVFHRLAKSGLIKANPFAEFDRVREPKKKKHLETDEFEKFIGEVAKIEDHGIAHLLMILAYTGIRRSEVLNIARSDVDMENNRFVVTNIKSRDGERRRLSIPVKAREHFAYFMNLEGDFPFHICQPNCLGRWAKY